MAGYVAPLPPAAFIAYPITAYSVSYDIFTRANEQDSPGGWNSYRSNIYRRLKNALTAAGFVRNQYSDWVHPNISGFNAWMFMLSLEGLIPPPHKLSSTVRGLRMARMDHFGLMDVTQDLQIGGAASTTLWGPVPAGLVPVPAALFPPAAPIPAGVPFARPVDSHAGPGVDNPANFLM
ncbi:hypothetical protein C8R46DRAFT_1208356 [Mycena filopes]|nr:hypothetical protein C8R46DRAFT_1208356 [Mycena filopes]